MPSVLSTKKLHPNQQELLFNAGLNFVEYDAITIIPVDFTLPRKMKNVIITSQNGASAFLTKTQELPLLEERAGVRCFVVGKKTTALLAEKGLKVSKTAQNGKELARFIAKNYKNDTFHYFCGNQRRDQLPSILKEARIICYEVVVYETHGNEQAFDQLFKGVLFYSPSGVKAFAKANSSKNTTAFCIGETTAQEASIYFENVVVSNDTTIESTIAKTVNYLKKITNLN